MSEAADWADAIVENRAGRLRLRKRRRWGGGIGGRRKGIIGV